MSNLFLVSLVTNSLYIEDIKTEPLAVCKTYEIAKVVKEKHEQQLAEHKAKVKECSISAEEWDNMWEWWLYHANEEIDFIDSLAIQYPQYTKEQLKLAEDKYDGEITQQEITISEIIYYDSENGINN